MFHFHLTRYWFNQFKKGLKTTEYRVANPREIARLNKECAFSTNDGNRIPCRLYCGYPKKDDSERILDGFVCGAHFVQLYNLPQAEKCFFLDKTDPDYRINDNTLFVAYYLEF